MSGRSDPGMGLAPGHIVAPAPGPAGFAHPPTRQAALARLAAVRPAAYARTRNALDGAVSGVSPYLTHGFISLDEALRHVRARHPLPIRHKWVFELGWRAYFRHVWAHRGAGILHSLHPGPLPDAAYARELPADLRQGRTGVPVVDRAVQTLYRTGWLHNHARMWLASYVVHLRRVHWRTGADWLYGHLLDGDLASNHLSWQWVAGTGSHRPYLFNADNVARYAPPDWHSPGTVVDAPYEVLERLARRAAPAAPAGTAVHVGDALDEPLLHHSPPPGLAWQAPDAARVAGREVWLVHPWSLGELPAHLPADTCVVGVFPADFHRAWPWSAPRWRFVAARMAAVAEVCWWGDAAALAAALAGARRVRCQADPHLTTAAGPLPAAWAGPHVEAQPAADLFAPVDRRCDSFSQWWSRVTRGRQDAAELLAGYPDPAQPPLPLFAHPGAA